MEREGPKMQLTKTQKRHGKHGMGRSWGSHLHTKRNCAVSRKKRCYGSLGELATTGDESAQRLKTPTGSVKPACTLQELQAHKQEIAGYDDLTLNLPREELAPKSYEQSVEPKGERWRRMWVRVQGMWHCVGGNNFQTYRNYFGFWHWA